MRRYFKFLTTSLIACVLTIACVNELDLHQPINESEFYTTLVPRVEGFANQYITKSLYEGYEREITKLAILVFNEDGKCIHLQESENGGPITLNKSMLNSPEQSGKLDQATVVMIANIGTDKIVNGEKTIKDNWSDLTFSDLENYSFQYDDAQTIITSFGEGFSGFPMIGGASNVNLTSTSTKQEQAAIEVKLKILYAKIKFAISVENGTENEGSGMSFTLDNYSVFNASKQTKLAVPTNQGEPTMTFEEFLLGQKASESPQPATESSATESDSYAYAYNNPDPDNQDNQGSAAGPVSVSVVDEYPISFTFYVSESRFNHGLSVEQLANIYPDGWTTTSEAEDVKDYTEEDKNKLNGVKYFYDELAQQYKPLLAQSESGKPAPGLATYVLLNGKYKDYRGEIWNVNYKVYLGKDNSQNFQVDRNSCYTNNIVIKGIRNNDDTDGHGEVWIDHRVDVEIGDANSAADHITITRETLIDSHIEVRPLRVRWGTVNGKEEYDVVKLYLPTDGNKLVDWIGVERFVDGINNQDPSIYCYSNVTISNPVSKSTGKRRYFTDGLIKELQNKEGEFGVQSDDNGKFIYLHNTQCAWIYFDENNTTSDRTADIKLHFYKPDGTYIEEIYEVKQEGLLSLGSYYVESYEEYLHSYDSEDKYNLSTSPVDYTQQGLSWGLANKKISKDIIVSATSLELGLLGFQDWVTQRYDYFHTLDNPSGKTYYNYQKVGGKWTNPGYGTGLIFTNRASDNEDITVKDMGTVPDYAYQYCLSKNKFAVGDDGKVTMDIHWYLPDVYEMRDVLINASTGVFDLSDSDYYWTSQPSYTGQVTNDIALIDENPEKARAVSLASAKTKTPGEDQQRSYQNRIRCLYSEEGITANMDGRTPDGVGGNHTFVMKGSPADGYFKYMLPESEKTTIISDNYENEILKYPTKDNSSQSGAEFLYIVMTNQQKEGFVVNPLLKVNWNEYTDKITGIINDYYTTIAPNAFPGLSEYETEKHLIYDAYKQTNVKRADVEIRTENTERKKSQNLSSTLDKPLDYQKNNGDKLIITLSKNQGEYFPVFDYNELISSTTIQSTKYWNLPEYSSLEVLLTPDGETISAQGTGDNEQLILTDLDASSAKERAFNEAYAKAKTRSLNNLKNSIKSKYPGLKYDEALIRYEPEGLTINSQNDCITFKEREEGRIIKRKYIKCEITLTASLRGRDLLFKLTSDGVWGAPEEVSTPTQNLPQVKTDELRIYSGNSFTISLSDKYKNTYEITKVKVHYSGSYQISDGNLLNGGDATYMRFILDDPEIISLPISETVEKEGWLSQPTETLHLPGMGYSDGNNGGWQEWSGDGRSSVTLILAHYFVDNNVREKTYTYKYDNASTYFDKSIVIDKIEVKCTKKPEAGN